MKPLEAIYKYNPKLIVEINVPVRKHLNIRNDGTGRVTGINTFDIAKRLNKLVDVAEAFGKIKLNERGLPW